MTPMTGPKLLLSLHDVTPAHLPRLKRAESLFHDLGVTHMTYLVIPRYHGGSAIEEPEFRRWCRQARPFTVHWCLHGYYHEERITERHGRVSLWNWLARRLLTAGEGEFLDLREREAAARIDRGRRIFRACLGSSPRGFVAPAWLFNKALLATLREQGFAWTEDHWRVYQLPSGATIEAPVITWATRTFVRRHGSAVLAPLQLRCWRRRPVIRIAVHPLDFDDRRLVAEIRCVIASALRDRVLSTYDDILTVAHPNDDVSARSG